jgi:hypothetical protein
MEQKPKYKRSHSAMNANVVIPAFSISGGKVVTTGGDGQLSSDPLELIRSFGVVGEVSSCTHYFRRLPRFSIHYAVKRAEFFAASLGMAYCNPDACTDTDACPQVFVHDADAASGADGKENAKVMDLLLDLLPCRFSGGFTTNDRVYDWLDKGASVVVVEYSASNLGFLDGVPKVLPRTPCSSPIPRSPVSGLEARYR